MFSVRLVTADYYLAPPIKELDVCYSDFRVAQVAKVPVIRIFGTTPLGQKTCLHVHGVFPYILVPYDEEEKDVEKFTRMLAVSIDKAINIAQGSSNSSTQHVFKITLVSGMPFYGFHQNEQNYLRIYLYNPNLIKKTAELLQNGAIMNKIFQPHEAHIPFLLQMFIDYNLFGMSMVQLSNVKFRICKNQDLYVNESARDLSYSNSDNSSAYSSVTCSNYSKVYWNVNDIPRKHCLDESIEKQSTCELEIDALASSIMNRIEVDDAISNYVNPGLQTIWEDERQRKRQNLESSQITPPTSQERENFIQSEIEKCYLDRIKEIVEKQPVDGNSVLDISSSFDNTTPACRLERHQSLSNGKDPSNDIDEKALVDENKIQETMNSLLDDSFSGNINSEELVEIMAGMISNTPTDKKCSNLPDAENEIEQESVEMSQIIWYNAEHETQSAGDFLHRAEEELPSNQKHLSGSNDCNSTSKICSQTLMQLDGANDQKFTNNQEDQNIKSGYYFSNHQYNNYSYMSPPESYPRYSQNYDYCGYQNMWWSSSQQQYMPSQSSPSSSSSVNELSSESNSENTHLKQNGWQNPHSNYQNEYNISSGSSNVNPISYHNINVMSSPFLSDHNSFSRTFSPYTNSSTSTGYNGFSGPTTSNHNLDRQSNNYVSSSYIPPTPVFPSNPLPIKNNSVHTSTTMLHQNSSANKTYSKSSCSLVKDKTSFEPVLKEYTSLSTVKLSEPKIPTPLEFVTKLQSCSSTVPSAKDIMSTKLSQSSYFSSSKKNNGHNISDHIPTPITSKSCLSTSFPDLGPSKSGLGASKPVLSTSKPVLSTSKPVLSTSKPILSTSKPSLGKSKVVLPKPSVESNSKNILYLNAEKEKNESFFGNKIINKNANMNEFETISADSIKEILQTSIAVPEKKSKPPFKAVSVNKKTPTKLLHKLKRSRLSLKKRSAYLKNISGSTDESDDEYLPSLSDIIKTGDCSPRKLRKSTLSARGVSNNYTEKCNVDSNFQCDEDTTGKMHLKNNSETVATLRTETQCVKTIAETTHCMQDNLKLSDDSSSRGSSNTTDISGKSESNIFSRLFPSAQLNDEDAVNIAKQGKIVKICDVKIKVSSFIKSKQLSKIGRERVILKRLSDDHLQLLKNVPIQPVRNLRKSIQPSFKALESIQSDYIDDLDFEEDPYANEMLPDVIKPTSPLKKYWKITQSKKGLLSLKVTPKLVKRSRCHTAKEKHTVASNLKKNNSKNSQQTLKQQRRGQPQKEKILELCTETATLSLNSDSPPKALIQNTRSKMRRKKHRLYSNDLFPTDSENCYRNVFSSCNNSENNNKVNVSTKLFADQTVSAQPVKTVHEINRASVQKLKHKTCNKQSDKLKRKAIVLIEKLDMSRISNFNCKLNVDNLIMYNPSHNDVENFNIEAKTNSAEIKNRKKILAEKNSLPLSDNFSSMNNSSKRNRGVQTSSFHDKASNLRHFNDKNNLSNKGSLLLAQSLKNSSTKRVNNDSAENFGFESAEDVYEGGNWLSISGNSSETDYEESMEAIKNSATNNVSSEKCESVSEHSDKNSTESFSNDLSTVKMRPNQVVLSEKEFDNLRTSVVGNKLAQSNESTLNSQDCEIINSNVSKTRDTVNNCTEKVVDELLNAEQHEISEKLSHDVQDCVSSLVNDAGNQNVCKDLDNLSEKLGIDKTENCVNEHGRHVPFDSNIQNLSTDVFISEDNSSVNVSDEKNEHNGNTNRAQPSPDIFTSPILQNFSLGEQSGPACDYVQVHVVDYAEETEVNSSLEETTCNLHKEFRSVSTFDTEGQVDVAGFGDATESNGALKETKCDKHQGLHSISPSDNEDQVHVDDYGEQTEVNSSFENLTSFTEDHKSIELKTDSVLKDVSIENNNKILDLTHVNDTTKCIPDQAMKVNADMWSKKAYTKNETDANFIRMHDDVPDITKSIILHCESQEMKDDLHSKGVCVQSDSDKNLSHIKMCKTTTCPVDQKHDEAKVDLCAENNELCSFTPVNSCKTDHKLIQVKSDSFSENNCDTNFADVNKHKNTTYNLDQESVEVKADSFSEGNTSDNFHQSDNHLVNCSDKTEMMCSPEMTAPCIQNQNSSKIKVDSEEISGKNDNILNLNPVDYSKTAVHKLDQISVEAKAESNSKDTLVKNKDDDLTHGTGPQTYTCTIDHKSIGMEADLYTENKDDDDSAHDMDHSEQSVVNSSLKETAQCVLNYITSEVDAKIHSENNKMVNFSDLAKHETNVCSQDRKLVEDKSNSSSSATFMEKNSDDSSVHETDHKSNSCKPNQDSTEKKADSCLKDTLTNDNDKNINIENIDGNQDYRCNLEIQNMNSTNLKITDRLKNDSEIIKDSVESLTSNVACYLEIQKLPKTCENLKTVNKLIENDENSGTCEQVKECAKLITNIDAVSKKNVQEVKLSSSSSLPNALDDSKVNRIEMFNVSHPEEVSADEEIPTTAETNVFSDAVSSQDKISVNSEECSSLNSTNETSDLFISPSLSDTHEVISSYETSLMPTPEKNSQCTSETCQERNYKVIECGEDDGSNSHTLNSSKFKKEGISVQNDDQIDFLNDYFARNDGQLNVECSSVSKNSELSPVSSPLDESITDDPCLSRSKIDSFYGDQSIILHNTEKCYENDQEYFSAEDCSIPLPSARNSSDTLPMKQESKVETSTIIEGALKSANIDNFSASEMSPETANTVNVKVQSQSAQPLVKNIIITPCAYPPNRQNVLRWIKENNRCKNEENEKKIHPPLKLKELEETFNSFQGCDQDCSPKSSRTVTFVYSEGKANERATKNKKIKLNHHKQIKISRWDKSPNDNAVGNVQLKHSSSLTTSKDFNDTKIVPRKRSNSGNFLQNKIEIKRIHRVPESGYTSAPIEPDQSTEDRSAFKKTFSEHKMRSSIGRKMSDDSSLEGPSFNNTFNFNLSMEDFSRHKSINQDQHLTTMSLEVHVNTRGNLKPDPELDAVIAIFYYIQHDETSLSNNENNSCGILLNHAAHSSPEPCKFDNIKKLAHCNKDQLCPSNTKDINQIHELKQILSHQCAISNVNVTVVGNEELLFQELIHLIRRNDPDILVGFEIQMSSWGFLIDRASHLKIDLCPQLSRIPECASSSHSDEIGNWYGADHMSEINIAGRIVLNGWRIFRSHVTLNIYTFENVYYHILHQRVPAYSSQTITSWFSQKSHFYRWKAVEYYAIRVHGIIKMLNQINCIGQTSELARVFGIQFYDVLTRGSQLRVESLMLRSLRMRNYIAVSPSIHQRAQSAAPECIPLVMEPQSKFYKDPVLVLDFQSLYPSICIAHNYCYSTCLGRVKLLGKSEPFKFGCLNLQIPPSLLQELKDDISVSPTGQAFVKEHVRQGIIPQMLSEILNTRIMVKKSMKNWKDDKCLQKLLDARQLGLKMIANVTYGYTSANFSGRMPCVEVADSIVSKARQTLEQAIQLVQTNEKWSAKVIYGDTDSMFVLLPGRTKEEAFKIGNEIAAVVTEINPKPIKLKFEKVYLPCILQTKKRYCGFMYESEDQVEPVYDAKGIETVRRDSCSAVSKILEKSIRILFNSLEISQVKDYVVRQFHKIAAGKISLQDYIFSKEYRGRQNYRPGACVPALKLARKFLQHDRRSEPRVGERVPYVIVYGSPGLPLIQLVRTPHELLQDTSLRINSNYYITRIIAPALNRVISLLGVDALQWYSEMPRVSSMQPYALTDNSSPAKSTISHYFKKLNCPVCNQITNEGICAKCQENPQNFVVQLNEKIRYWERSYDDVIKICQSCSGGSDSQIECISLDCPNLFKYHNKKIDLHQADHLRKLMQSALEF